MCGISAVLLSEKNKDVFDILTCSLRALQNRGYDSCGIVDGNLKCFLKKVKKSETYNQDENIPDDAVEQLSKLKNIFPETQVGMAHTRWATSGKKTVDNAHPHVSLDGEIAVVHNGIIENYGEIKNRLSEIGFEFYSQTDTEVIPNLISHKLNNLANNVLTEKTVVEAIREAGNELEGSWAIVVIHKRFPDSVFVSRNGNPLLIGVNNTDGSVMVSSEIAGFVNNVEKYAILENNEVLHIKKSFTEKDIIEQSNKIIFQEVPKEIIKLTPGKFPYFMAKEIYEQEIVVKNPCNWYKFKNLNISDNPELSKMEELRNLCVKKNGVNVLLVGCGTSYHSGLSGEWFFDEYPVRSAKCIIASELTEKNLPRDSRGDFDGRTLAIFISQSGETLDTYKALQLVKKFNIPTIALVNVENSMIARECDYAVYLNAGREVGVASTKAYVTQIIGLHLISCYLKNKEISEDYFRLCDQIQEILEKYFPYEVLDNKYEFNQTPDIQNIATSFDKSNHGFSLASGSLQATAYESSLKIKEIGRIFIQGYPTASLKHGPFSLIEKDVPILFCLQKGDENILRKTNSAIEEVHLRGALIYLVTDIEDYENDKVNEIIKIPHNETFSSILFVIPFQIISFYIAKIRNLNCDRPMNLAKCVTTD